MRLFNLFYLLSVGFILLSCMLLLGYKLYIFYMKIMFLHFLKTKIELSLNKNALFVRKNVYNSGSVFRAVNQSAVNQSAEK